MRCTCCNKRLSDYETTLKHAVTGEYLDTCMDCLSDITYDVPLPVKARKDLVNMLHGGGGMNFDKDVDELSEDEYNKYSKGDTEED